MEDKSKIFLKQEAIKSAETFIDNAKCQAVIDVEKLIKKLVEKDIETIN